LIILEFNVVRNNENGSVLIEFIIILPIFLTLIFTAITIGMIIYTKTLIVTAINNGVHKGMYIGNSSEYSDNEKIEEVSRVVEYGMGNAPLNNGYDIRVIFEDDYINIEVDYNFMIVIPFVKMFFENESYLITERARGYIQPEMENWEGEEDGETYTPEVSS